MTRPVSTFFPKWPFFLTNILLSAFAMLILFYGKGSVVAMIFSIVTASLASIALIIPFMIEYKDRLHLAICRQGQIDTEETAQLKGMLSSLANALQSFGSHSNKLDQSLHILDSLLKRYDSKLPANSNPLAAPAHVVANLQVGIGSKLFIRGQGPGLSWEKGIAMNLDSVGKWTWTSSPTAQPIQFQIFKNDEMPLTTGPVELNPGQTHLVSPSSN